MDLIKKIFSFNDDENSAIGLCQFNDSFMKKVESKESFKKQVSKNITLSQMLKRPV